MFLHSGASLHGHEFSPIHTPTARIPLVRSAFSTPPPGISPYDKSTPTTTRPGRQLSIGQRRTCERVFSSGQDVDTMSEDGCSYVSEGSDTTTGGTKKKKRRSTRSRTSYQIAYPAPTLTRQQKLLHIRPRLLLQLQQLSPGKRPVPTLDVLPSTVVVPRLSKTFRRMFKGKGELGANDVMIVKSEDYNAPDDSNNIDVPDYESLSNRDVVAVICQLRDVPGSSEICLDDGSVWYGSPTLKGGFEFVTTDPITDEKTTARWVQRLRSGRSSSLPATPPSGSSTPSDQKYLFSILDPNSRRHPILASITQHTLDIPDSYTTISSSAGRYPPTSPIRNSTFDRGLGADEDGNQERTTVNVDENLRTLIQVTGIWVALRQGWCPYFKYDNISTGSPGRATSIPLVVSGNRVSSNPNMKVGGKEAAADTRASTRESNQSTLDGVGGKILRSSTQLFRGNSSGSSLASSNQTVPAPRPAVSTGTAFMQRATARRTGNPPSTVESESEGELVPPATIRPVALEDTSGLAGCKPPPPASNSLSHSIASRETTTKSLHRRVQSVFMPSSSSHTRSPNELHRLSMGQIPTHLGQAVRCTDDVQHSKQRKGGRLSFLIGFLRPSNKSATK